MLKRVGLDKFLRVGIRFLFSIWVSKLVFTATSIHAVFPSYALNSGPSLLLNRRALLLKFHMVYDEDLSPQFSTLRHLLNFEITRQCPKTGSLSVSSTNYRDPLFVTLHPHIRTVGSYKHVL